MSILPFSLYRFLTPSVFLLLFLIKLPVVAQEVFVLKHSCSFDGEQEGTEIYTNEPSDEALTLVRNIMKLNVLPQNFIVKSGNCQNALAAVEGKQRYIMYSTSFLESFKKDENARWAANCVMAHEIGHHLSNHDMEETTLQKRKFMEIQADKFAGGILFRMGATLAQAQSGIERYTQEGESRTHPPKSARLEAVASGWKQMQENMQQMSGNVPTATTQPTEKKEQNNTGAKKGTKNPSSTVKKVDSPTDIEASDWLVKSINAQDKELCITYLSKAIEVKPDYLEAYVRRARLYQLVGKKDLSLQDHNTCIALMPSAGAYTARAAQYTEMNRYNDAIADYNKAIELSPNEDVLHLYKGIVYYLMGQLEIGKVSIRKAIAMNPNARSVYEKYLNYNGKDEAVGKTNVGQTIYEDALRGKTYYFNERGAKIYLN